jgi:hypothetical protein
MMTETEILTEIRHLPLSGKKNVFNALAVELKPKNDISEEERLEQEVDQMLISRGLMREIPLGMTDDEEYFEPISTTGRPLSEIIIEERR